MKINDILLKFSEPWLLYRGVAPPVAIVSFPDFVAVVMNHGWRISDDNVEGDENTLTYVRPFCGLSDYYVDTMVINVLSNTVSIF